MVIIQHVLIDWISFSGSVIFTNGAFLTGLSAITTVNKIHPKYILLHHLFLKTPVVWILACFSIKGSQC
uniref:Uncharacterized protein n=1 Tax=Anguilla anguilla TaxID=7936 RepID=A0A0E9WFT0_ANGAN